MSQSSSERVKQRASWFFKRILNSRAVVTLIIILLVILVIFMFTQIAYLFQPVLTFLNLVAFPIVASGILYYLFSPLVDKLSQRGVDKRIAIWAIFAIIIVLIVWGISTLIPILRNQAQSFVDNLPYYTEQINSFIQSLPFDFSAYQFSSDVMSLIESFDITNLTERVNTIISSTFGGLGSVIGTITQFIAGLFTMPVLLYYLLLEGYKIPRYILYYLPTKYRQSVSRMLFRSNYQISQYIRGQILVAITVGIIFAIGYSIIGLDYAVSLAVIAGIANIIPYLGSFIAVIPALIIGLLTSPYMFIKVIIVLAVEQTIEGRFVSPQILGNNLQIHPVTILLVLLGAGRLFGLSGVILGVPGYAVIKVIVGELYNYYRQQSDLYDDNEEINDFSMPEVIAEPANEDNA